MYIHFSKSLQGSKWAITMHPVFKESTLLLFLCWTSLIWRGRWLWHRVRKWFINHWFIYWLYIILQNSSIDKAVPFRTFLLSNWFWRFTGNNWLQIGCKSFIHHKWKKMQSTEATVDPKNWLWFPNLKTSGAKWKDSFVTFFWQ